MLPDVNADDGHVREQRVLVRGGDDLEAARARVQSLIQSNPQSIHHVKYA